MPAGGCTMLCVTPLLPLLLNTVLGFKLCPSHCLCYESSDLVDCRNRGLVRVPPSVPHGTWLLDLSGNKLTEVRTGSFMGLWSLKILLMSKNSIQSLQPQELRLDHNLLQYLDSTSLVDFENLRRLDLSYNRIRAMDVRAFGSLSRLSLLNLEGNGLYVLQDGLLCRQQSLEVLLLSHNNISVIETEALAPLRSLTLLSLQGNQLKHIRFKTFLKLQTTTTHLQMSSNPWICDCELQRVFSKIQHVRHLRVLDYKDIVCHAPAQQAGSSLAATVAEMREKIRSTE